MRSPSLLPGWSRAHVLTHIARNADGISATVSGALRGEVVKRYPGGPEQRDGDIAAGAGRSVLELLGDVRESAERLDRIFAAAAEADGWDLPTEDRTVGEYVTARWRELEIHRVDLGGSYRPSDWPPAFVTYLVAELLTGLDKRIEGSVRIAVTDSESVTTDLPGSEWTVGSGTPVQVKGPDWAIAAWLAGRPDAATGVLSATPDIAPWM